MSVHTINPPELHIDQWAVQNEIEALHRLRELLRARRDASIAWDADNREYLISAPKVGNRNPKTPQPTPPLSNARGLLQAANG